MGLDMYLNANRSFYAGEWTDKSERETNEKLRELFPDMFKTGNLDYVRVEFEAGYWRKANQIHQWFVDNVQNGEDDCGDYYVAREQLKELLELCKQILNASTLKEGLVNNGYQLGENLEKIPIVESGQYIENPDVAKELLPTTDGFFFGSTDYDEWYYRDIEHTIEIIEKCLTLPKEWDFEYHSSW